MAVDYFQKLFTPEREMSSHKIRGGFSVLLEYEKGALSRDFTIEDIRSALFQMHPNKAPGPDGFHALFFQKFWKTVREAVCGYLLPILNGDASPEEVNGTLITLIPKTENPQNLTQFRPISLCNVLYKIVSKCLVNRIKPILPTLVSPNQSSFVPKRQITNNIIISQEVIHTMRKKTVQRQWMILKLDLEKAYDRVCWGFLRDTLDALDIPKDWTNKVMKCVETTSMQVLWNGEKTERFRPKRGLRQGDPLSPYLFVLIMERLSHLINQVLLCKQWKPIKLSRNSPPLTHLFFADDLVLFAEASMKQVDIIKETMNKFCEASGQKVSLDKSVMMVSANTREQKAKDLANRLGIKITKDLGKYLGVPTINRRITKNTFREVVTRVHKRLEGWQTQFLSFAGRLTLIKSVTSTIPLYTMQTLPLPASACDELDTVNKRFLWAGDHMKKSIHQVSWSKVCSAKYRGGLGLRSMRQANLTSLAKLGWRFLIEKETLWARVLAEKYKVKDGSPRSLKNKHGQSPTWRGIVKAVPVLNQGSTRVIAGGHETDFWEDPWTGNGRLIEQVQTPIPPALRHRKVAAFWEHDRGWKWNELATLLPQHALLQMAPISLDLAPGEKDRLSWKGTPDGKFTFRSAYDLLSGNNNPDADVIESGLEA
ncbi:reverse transcriptase [Gossypium australe]|uniref:Reverse transcriptase n=1 Tax=Gossypium australe TaxID=47621 RepID=A0A5B6VU08_9ROSI|nr:reverse transcriptase [Gossypium australe]